MHIVDDSWICKVCGALNAAYRTTCGRCEENKLKDMEQRQFRSRQGRSDKQYEESGMVLVLAGALILGATLGYLLISSIIVNTFI